MVWQLNSVLHTNTTKDQAREQVLKNWTTKKRIERFQTIFCHFVENNNVEILEIEYLQLKFKSKRKEANQRFKRVKNDLSSENYIPKLKNE